MKVTCSMAKKGTNCAHCKHWTGQGNGHLVCYRSHCRFKFSLVNWFLVLPLVRDMPKPISIYLLAIIGICAFISILALMRLPI